MSDRKLGVAEIDRKYEVLEKMGEGGMGAIYKVRHVFLDEERVIKMIRPQLQEDEDLQARFLREAQVATQLRHPNIAEMYDFSVGEDGTAYIVMEFIDGMNLAEVLKLGNPMSSEEVFAISRQTLRALGYLHRKQFVHRDVSPDNIMLTRDQEGRPLVKLIDLGIAKPLEGAQWKTRTGVFIGKVRYVSPEQLGGVDEEGEVDARSDLYSFGIVLYELLTWQFPITGNDDMSIIAGHLYRPPRSFDDTDPEGKIPEALRTAVMKALEKNADERYEDAETFVQAIDAAVGWSESEAGVLPTTPLTPVHGGKPSTTGTAPTLAKTIAEMLPGTEFLTAKRRWPLAALAAILILVLAGIAWMGLRPESATSTSSESQALQPSPPPPPTAEADLQTQLAKLNYGRFFALIIGNDDYLYLPRLETAVNDARDLAALLEQRYGYEVTLLTDATRSEIITALYELSNQLTARDNLLVYYAGHGQLEGTQSGYWQPVDAEVDSPANWISTSHEVTSTLETIAAKRLLVVADSCYSGSLSEQSDILPDQIENETERLRYIQDTYKRRARLALTSGGLSPVLDQGTGEHSVFANALLDVLSDNAEIVEVTRIFSEVNQRVTAAATRYGVEQDPQLGPIPLAGDEGGEFFFVPTSS